MYETTNGVLTFIYVSRWAIDKNYIWNKSFAGPNGPKIKNFITGRAGPEKLGL